MQDFDLAPYFLAGIITSRSDKKMILVIDNAPYYHKIALCAVLTSRHNG